MDELLDRINAAIAEADKLPVAPPDSRGGSWDKSTASGGGPPEGMFNMGASTIAGIIIKSSKTKEQAIGRLSFWRKRAGGTMSRDQVHLVKQAAHYIRNSSLPDVATESIEMGDYAGSYFPDVAAVITAAAAFDPCCYCSHSDEEEAVKEALWRSDGMPTVVVWCPEYFEYRVGPLQDLPVVCTGSPEFEIVTAFEDGAPIDIQHDDILGDADIAAMLDDTSDALDRDHNADAAVRQFVYDPDQDNDNDATPWGDTDADFHPDARTEGAEIDEKLGNKLKAAGHAARVNDVMPWVPLSAHNRQVLRLKGRWLLNHAPKLAAYNKRFSKVRSRQEGDDVEEAYSVGYIAPGGVHHHLHVDKNQRDFFPKGAAPAGYKLLKFKTKAAADKQVAASTAHLKPGASTLASHKVDEATDDTEGAVLDVEVAREIDEMRVKRRRHSARVSANRTADKAKGPARRKASLRMRMWKKRNRHHLQRYRRKYKAPGTKLGGKKKDESVEGLLLNIQERTGQAVRFSQVGDTRPSLVFPGCSDTVKAVKEQNGFEVREEVWGSPDGESVTVTSVYTKEGHFVGDEKFAKFLAKRGIAPEKAEPGHNVCSIGWCEKDQRWYGWSHRAIQGFKIGDKTVVAFPEGTSQGKPITTKDEARAAAIAFADSVS